MIGIKINLIKNYNVDRGTVESSIDLNWWNCKSLPPEILQILSMLDWCTNQNRRFGILGFLQVKIQKFTSSNQLRLRVFHPHCSFSSNSFSRFSNFPLYKIFVTSLQTLTASSSGSFTIEQLDGIWVDSHWSLALLRTILWHFDATAGFFWSVT